MPIQRPSLARRPRRDEPFDASATWARRLAVLALVLAVCMVATAHRSLLSPLSTAALLIAVVGLAGLVLVLALVACLRIWRSGYRGMGRLLFGCLLAFALLAYPVKLVASVARAPLAADLSTDPVHPPPFGLSRKATGARGESEWPWRFLAASREHGPEPVVMDVDAAAAYEAVLSTASTLRWRIIEAVPPGGRSGLGHVDAIVESAVLRLPTDIAIRITPLAAQSRVDIRAASRLGLPDAPALRAQIDAMAQALSEQDDGK